MANSNFFEFADDNCTDPKGRQVLSFIATVAGDIVVQYGVACKVGFDRVRDASPERVKAIFFFITQDATPEAFSKAEKNGLLLCCVAAPIDDADSMIRADGTIGEDIDQVENFLRGKLKSRIWAGAYPIIVGGIKYRRLSFLLNHPGFKT